MTKTKKILLICVGLFISIQTIKYIYKQFNNSKYQYIDLEQNEHSLSELPKKNSFYIYFLPDCDYCSEVVQIIKKKPSSLQKFNFVFITEEKDTTKIKQFVYDNKLLNITPFVYIDRKKSFSEEFGLSISNINVPEILYYDKNGKFIKEIKNHADLETFL
ncbi:MAG: hypothetical protein K2Q03_03820 [Sphingobacteriaceae bacterium]|nr:hypothetical protein [Sphingobacteriaceae bacterium]